MATADTAELRAAVERLLDALGLREFVFTLEAKESACELHVECATNGAWQTVTLAVDPAELQASGTDAAARDRLRMAWHERLRECARQPR